MKLTSEVQSTIDALPYVRLLDRWRYAPIGDEMFEGESGDYWAQRTKELRALPGGDALNTSCSKSIGWDGERWISIDDPRIVMEAP